MLVHVKCEGLHAAIGGHILVAEICHEATNGVSPVSGHSIVAVTVITMR